MKNENASKIKVLIDMEIKSLTKLFNGCVCVKEIKFFNLIELILLILVICLIHVLT